MLRSKDKMKSMFCSADILSKMFGPSYQVNSSKTKRQILKFCKHFDLFPTYIEFSRREKGTMKEISIY